jgi:hypothetical protein
VSHDLAHPVASAGSDHVGPVHASR